MSKSFIEHSRTKWQSTANDVTYPGYEQMTIGCLQRIADATELMAKDRQSMIEEVESLKRDRDLYQKWYRAEVRKVTALKGVITKMKKKLNNG